MAQIHELKLRIEAGGPKGSDSEIGAPQGREKFVDIMIIVELGFYSWLACTVCIAHGRMSETTVMLCRRGVTRSTCRDCAVCENKAYPEPPCENTSGAPPQAAAKICRFVS